MCWHAIACNCLLPQLFVSRRRHHGDTKFNAPDGPNRLEWKVLGFTNSHLPVGRVRQQAGHLLASGDLLQVIQALTPEEQGIFMGRVDQVRRLGCLSIISSNTPLFTKPTAETQNAALLTALGEACSATHKLSASADV